MHEAIAMLRQYDGTTDPKEFIEHYEIDLGRIGYDIGFAITNLDRALKKDLPSNSRLFTWFQCRLQRRLGKNQKGIYSVL
jgi:hypothetical protein